MLNKILYMIIFSFGLAIIFCLYKNMQIRKEYRILKNNADILLHDLKSSIATFSLSIYSVKNLVLPQNKSCIDNASSTSDLSTLLSILEKTGQNINNSIAQWNKCKKIVP